MATKINEIQHQFARVGTAYSFQIPANTFSSGSTITYSAGVARKTKAISLNRFWISFDPSTRTFSGTPQDFDDEGVLQIEVTATSSEGTAKAYFTIITYAAGTTTTTVLPRTSAECDLVIDDNTLRNANSLGAVDCSSVQPGDTIGIKGLNSNRIRIVGLNGTEDAPILITNVDGVAEVANGVGDKVMNFLRCSYIKVIGQYAEDVNFNEPIYGLKLKSGNSGVKVLPDGSPNPDFDFAGNNGGGSALEWEGHSRNHIEVAYVHVPYSSSAGIKIRTKHDELSLTSDIGNNTGNTTFKTKNIINRFGPASGRFQIDGQIYSFSSVTDYEYQGVSPTLIRNYAENEVATTGHGVRFYHDMNWVKMHFNLLENCDTESYYIGEGFFSGRSVTQPGLPHDIRNVRIQWNISINSGWDPIQIKNCVDNMKCRYNYCYNNSYRKASSQQFGIFISDGTDGEVSHNFIHRVSGTGMRLYQGGNLKVFNNVIIDIGLNTNSAENQAIYGARQGGYVTQTFTSNTGGYDLTNYNSRPDLTPDQPLLLKMQIFNNTLVNFTGSYIEVYADITVEYGNNLIVNGTNIQKGDVTSLGGDTFGTVNDLDLINPSIFDYRIGSTSPARTGGIDQTAIIGTQDMNFNTITSLNYSGAYMFDSQISEDNFNYLADTFDLSSPFTSFKWYESTSQGGTYTELFGEVDPVLTNAIDGRWYRRGVVVKDKSDNQSQEVLSNEVQFLSQL